MYRFKHPHDLVGGCLFAPLVQWQNDGIVNHRRQSDSDRGLNTEFSPPSRGSGRGLKNSLFRLFFDIYPLSRLDKVLIIVYNYLVV